MSVKYESHFPRIAAEIRPRVALGTRAGTELVAETAKANVTVGARDPHLRDAIHVEFRGDADWAVVAGNREVFWGNFVENGTVNAPPKPFLVPALESKKHEVELIVARALRTLR